MIQSDKQYDMIVFDVDGTLLDTSEGLIAAALYTIYQHHLPMPSREQLISFIGPPIQVSFARFFPSDDPDQAQRLTEAFRVRYSRDDLFKAAPYPGMLELWKAIHAAGKSIGVATYKRQDYAAAIVRHFGFGEYTDIIYGADNFNKLKKKDIIRLCLEHGNVPPERALMIGDSDNDANGAREAGIDFLGVTYGFGFRKPADARALGAIAAAANTKDIADFLGLKLG